MKIKEKQLSTIQEQQKKLNDLLNRIGILEANKWYCALFVANGDGSGGIAAGEMTLYLNGTDTTIEASD